MSCRGPRRADVYMMEPGATPHLSAKVLQEYLQGAWRTGSNLWQHISLRISYWMQASTLWDSGATGQVGLWVLHCHDVSRLAAVNCPLPKPPTGGKIAHDKAVTGTSVKYGHSWTYECTPPKAPSHQRGSCQADGTTTEPPVCRGTPPTSFRPKRPPCQLV